MADRQIRQLRLLQTVVEVAGHCALRGLDLAPPAFKILPRRLLVAATNAEQAA